jgi:hypothetical protein
VFLFLTDEVITGKELINIPQKIKFPLYTLLEYSFFSILIFQQLKLKSLKLIIIVLSLCFLVFQFIYYFLPHRQKIDSVPIGFETILIFIFIFFFLYEEFKDVRGLPIYENYFFLISIGLFIYLGGCFFIYLLANTIDAKELDKYWFFTYVVEIIKNLLFIFSILVYSKNPNKSNNSNQTLPNLDFML